MQLIHDILANTPLDQILAQGGNQELARLQRSNTTLPNSQKGRNDTCPKCKGMGMLEYESEAESIEMGYPVKRMKICECEEVRKLRLRMERSGIADAFKAVSFDGFEAWDQRVAVAKSVAQGYVDGYFQAEHTMQNSFALLGVAGAGKTTLGICVLNRLMCMGVGVLYTGYREMVQALKANNMSENYDGIVSRFAMPRVLFIDDLYRDDANGQISAKDPKYLYDVVNARYLANKPMIITSNRTVREIIDIDEIVGSRIVEMCRDYLYELRGEGLNYRLRGLV